MKKMLHSNCTITFHYREAACVQLFKNVWLIHLRFSVFRNHLSLRVQTTLLQWWLNCTTSWQTTILRTKSNLKPLNSTCMTSVFVQTGQFCWSHLHVFHFFQFAGAEMKGKLGRALFCSKSWTIYCSLLWEEHFAKKKSLLLMNNYLTFSFWFLKWPEIRVGESELKSRRVRRCNNCFSFLFCSFGFWGRFIDIKEWKPYYYISAKAKTYHVPIDWQFQLLFIFNKSCLYVLAERSWHRNKLNRAVVILVYPYVKLCY